MCLLCVSNVHSRWYEPNTASIRRWLVGDTEGNNFLRCVSGVCGLASSIVTFRRIYEIWLKPLVSTFLWQFFFLLQQCKGRNLFWDLRGTSPFFIKKLFLFHIQNSWYILSQKCQIMLHHTPNFDGKLQKYEKIIPSKCRQPRQSAKLHIIEALMVVCITRESGNFAMS